MHILQRFIQLHFYRIITVFKALHVLEINDKTNFTLFCKFFLHFYFSQSIKVLVDFFEHPLNNNSVCADSNFFSIKTYRNVIFSYFDKEHEMYVCIELCSVFTNLET